ncbi:MAG: hypothetical protein EPN47_00775 [Acidobacteria bacterium]|nr:MAG: hypothetical protein EPN47_00775 [Acidobacteriota bacterium]
MKTLRSMIIPASVLMMFLGLAAGMEAQTLRVTSFAGKFTLPFMAQWGRMTLPPGNYNLYYGNLGMSGPRMVEVANEDLGVQRGLILPVGEDIRKATRSVLVCVLEGDKAYVRSLEMAEIGQSINFERPHGVSVDAWIVAGEQIPNTNRELAEARIAIVPVK